MKAARRVKAGSRYIQVGEIGEPQIVFAQQRPSILKRLADLGEVLGTFVSNRDLDRIVAEGRQELPLRAANIRRVGVAGQPEKLEVVGFPNQPQPLFEPRVVQGLWVGGPHRWQRLAGAFGRAHNQQPVHRGQDDPVGHTRAAAHRGEIVAPIQHHEQTSRGGIQAQVEREGLGSCRR